MQKISIAEITARQSRSDVVEDGGKVDKPSDLSVILNKTTLRPIVVNSQFRLR